MVENICLIQLVSEQTMQNVLPILAFKPARVVHLVTPKTAARSDWIVESARQASVAVRSTDVVQLSAMPDVTEVASAIVRELSAAKQAGEMPIINFTGGTKLMSIGAHMAAEKLQVMSVYVDTDSHCFVDGHTGSGLSELLNSDLSFTPHQRLLNVNAVAVANGCGRVTGGRDYSPYIQFADYLLENSSEEQKLFNAINGPEGLFPGGREPGNERDWQQLVSWPVGINEPLIPLAVATGLVVQRGLKCYLSEPSGSVGSGRQHYQFIHGFLAGGWWEVAVASRARRAGLFRDVRWSIDAGNAAQGSMEEDVVAIAGVRAAYFSCKRGGAKAKLTRQLEEMHASAERIGGRFVSKYFCVYLPPQGPLAKSLGTRARQLNVTLLDRSNVDRTFGLKA